MFSAADSVPSCFYWFRSLSCFTLTRHRRKAMLLRRAADKISGDFFTAVPLLVWHTRQGRQNNYRDVYFGFPASHVRPETWLYHNCKRSSTAYDTLGTNLNLFQPGPLIGKIARCLLKPFVGTKVWSNDSVAIERERIRSKRDVTKINPTREE